MSKFKEKEEECEACKKLRINLTWKGDPPRCDKHTKKPEIIRKV